MGLENLVHYFDTSENKENLYENYPVKIVRTSENELIMRWDKNDKHDPRPSYWETVLINNINDLEYENKVKAKVKVKEKTLTVKGYYESSDSYESSRWGELSLLLRVSNLSGTTYEVDSDKDTETKKIVDLLREIKIGVELYSLYKRLPPDIQKDNSEIIEDRVGDEYYDEKWWQTSQIFGIKFIVMGGVTLEI